MIPVSLSLENFASHIKSHLDFTQFDAALLIGVHEDNPDKSNAAGKSAIFEAICFSLFGKTKYSSKDRVVHRGKSYCSVEFVFDLSDGRYKVVRTLDVRSNLSDVTFYHEDAGVWEVKPYTGDTNTETTKNITEKLGITYEAFGNITYFKQSDIAGFAAAQTSKRKDILQNILQIGMWDKCQKIAKDESKRLINERDSITSRIIGLGNIEEEIIKNEEQIKNIKHDSKKYKNVVSDIEQKLFDLGEEIVNLEMVLSKSGATNRRRLEEKLEMINSKALINKERMRELKEKIKTNNKMIETRHNDSLNVQLKILELSKDVMVVEGNARDDIKNLLCNMSKENPRIIFEAPSIKYKEDILTRHREVQEGFKNKYDETKLKLSQLLSLEPGTECPTCLSNINNIDAINKMRESRKTFLECELKECVANLNEIGEVINKETEAIEKAKNSYMEIQRYGLVLAKHSSSINEIERYSASIKEEYIRLRDELSSLKEKKEKISKILSQTDGECKVQVQLDKSFNCKKGLLLELDDANKSVIECSVKQGSLEGYKEELERRISERETLISQRDILSIDVDAYTSLSRIFGRDGIQSIIIENVTEDLRSYTNSILRHLNNEAMTVDFVTQRQTVSGSWKEDFAINILKSSEIYDFGDLSGGEQVRVAFALRLALSKILMRRIGGNIRFLLLDEVDQSLDRHGIDVLADTINGLSNEFKILCITHNEYMKEKFENVITVHKGSSGSTIMQ